MKLKDGFVLRTVSGQTVVLPVSGDLDLNMMIKLNGTGKFLWENLQEETALDELVQKVLKAYDIDEASARTYVESFVQKLEKHGFLY